MSSFYLRALFSGVGTILEETETEDETEDMLDRPSKELATSLCTTSRVNGFAAGYLHSSSFSSSETLGLYFGSSDSTISASGSIVVRGSFRIFSFSASIYSWSVCISSRFYLSSRSLYTLIIRVISNFNLSAKTSMVHDPLNVETNPVSDYTIS